MTEKRRVLVPRKGYGDNKIFESMKERIGLGDVEMGAESLVNPVGTVAGPLRSFGPLKRVFNFFFGREQIKVPYTFANGRERDFFDFAAKRNKLYQGKLDRPQRKDYDFLKSLLTEEEQKESQHIYDRIIDELKILANSMRE